MRHDEDEQLKRELSVGPSRHSGFDERLKARIEQSIEQGAAPARSHRRLHWPAGISAAAVVAVIALFIIFGGQPGAGPDNSPDYVAVEGDQPSGQDKGQEPSYEEEPAVASSAVLIGLRQDNEADGKRPFFSSYRTVFVAPEEGELAVQAEGEGILMPYRQQFWVLQQGSFSEEKQDNAWQPIVAYAESSFSYSGERVEPSVFKTAMYEKIMFAGNHYVALQRTEQTGLDSRLAGGLTYLVKPVTDLALDKVVKSIQSEVQGRRETVVTLSELAAMAEAEGQEVPAVLLRDMGVQWSVLRSEGYWKAFEATVDEKASATEEPRTTWEELPLKLPVTIASYDERPANAAKIEQSIPGATDSFYSSSGDVAIVVGDKEIVVYTMRGDEPAPVPELSVKLKANESVVMVQWAEANYVDIWKERVTALLKKQQ